MAITINGSGTITGVSAGGLPDGSIDADTLASTLDLSGKTMTYGLADGDMPSGSILQVVQATKTDTFSSTSTSYVNVPDMSLSITPSSTSSKILVIVNMTVGQANSNFALSRLYRDSTAIAMPTTSSSYMSSMNSYPGDSLGGLAQITQVITWLDSPSTTSATTYKVMSMTTGGTMYVNARPASQNGTTPSSITAMEIAG